MAKKKGDREREEGAGERQDDGRSALLTIFSCINSLSITTERVCPSVNATIMRWSVSVRLRSLLPVLRLPLPPAFVSSSIHARAIITVR